MNYKKIALIFLFIISALLLLFVIIRTNIKTYNQCFYQIIDESDPTIDFAKLEEFETEEECNKYLKNKVKLIDFSRKGIVCEYVYIDEFTGGSSNLSEYNFNKIHSSIYAVLYNDKTIKYIKGYISGYPKYSLYNNFRTSDEKIINYSNTYNSNMLFIADRKEKQEKSILLNDSQYLRMIIKLKFLKLINLGTKKLPYENSYIAGFYFNEKWHYLNPKLRNFSDKTERNLEAYFRKCMHMTF